MFSMPMFGSALPNGPLYISEHSDIMVLRVKLYDQAARTQDCNRRRSPPFPGRAHEPIVERCKAMGVCFILALRIPGRRGRHDSTSWQDLTKSSPMKPRHNGSVLDTRKVCRPSNRNIKRIIRQKSRPI